MTAFVTTVLMWRIYHHRAGEQLPEALASAADPARTGRVAGIAHVIMICGIVTNGVGHEIVQSYPSGRTDPTWLITIMGGIAVFLVGRAVLERIVFSRLSRGRLIGILALLLLAGPALVVPPLAAAVAGGLVLLLIAIADTRRSWHRPIERSSPVR